MHDTVLHFIAHHVRRLVPNEDFTCVEFGGLDMNGTARSLFPKARWTSVDARPGKGVDVVSLAHKYTHVGNAPDVVICTEMLEHDPFWKESIRRMIDLLRPGGLLMLTWATPRRSPHGPEDSPTRGYYRGLTIPEVEDQIHTTWGPDSDWLSMFETDRDGEDGRGWASKPMSHPALLTPGRPPVDMDDGG